MIVLATESPYKIEQFQSLGIPFQTYAANIDESKVQSLSDLSVAEKAKLLANQKALKAKEKYPQATIIAGDQIAALENQVLTKPGNFQNNLEQLLMLQGKEHQLYTANCILKPNGEYLEALEIAKMQMHELSKDDIAKYLEMDKPFDCAGGYKYESTAGNQLFSKVEVGDPTSIQGLCLNFLKEQLT
tara:strand:+ start:19980 stop:20540 length:561 start_codon:yes stop_codon:yes gene_type:complete